MSKLLKPNQERFVLFPIQHNDVWQMREKAIACFWTANEIDLASDLTDWRDKLTEDERFFIKHILAFFAASDGIVNENIAVNFYSQAQIPEVRSFYAAQIQIEDIHAQTYSLLIDTYIQDSKEKAELFNAIETVDCVKKKANWALKYMSDNSSFAEQLVAFAAVEGIFFSGSFCSLFWLKNRGLMPGLTFSNELISRDEGMHCDFACLLYNNYLDVSEKITNSKVHNILIEACELEIEFVTQALPVRLLGMNQDKMVQYIKFVTDRLLVALNLPKKYNVDQPFTFMQNISLDGKTNFFERRVGDYQKAGVMQDSSSNEDKFQIDEDF